MSKKAKETKRPVEAVVEAPVPEIAVEVLDVLPPLEVPEETEDSLLPVVHALGWVAVPKKGWAVVEMKIQGRTVLSEQVVCEPNTRGVAFEQLKLALVRRMWSEGTKVSA